jgi:hypothetical protein
VGREGGFEERISAFGENANALVKKAAPPLRSDQHFCAARCFFASAMRLIIFGATCSIFQTNRKNEQLLYHRHGETFDNRECDSVPGDTVDGRAGQLAGPYQ